MNLADQGLFYLDLHTHSTDGSNDASATVEGYLRWIARRRELGYRIDGFVLTEHRHLDFTRDYSTLAARYGTVILRGIEAETDVGHVLVYGVTEGFLRQVDLSNPFLPHEELFRAARDHGGIAVGAHPGRPRIGLADHVDERRAALDVIELIEGLNGGSSDEENDRALRLAADHGFRTVAGSDSHHVTSIGRFVTAFRERVTSIEALTAQLRAGRVHVATAEETLDETRVRAPRAITPSEGT